MQISRYLTQVPVLESLHSPWILVDTLIHTLQNIIQDLGENNCLETGYYFTTYCMQQQESNKIKSVELYLK